jgi:hypothetical protein
MSEGVTAEKVVKTPVSFFTELSDAIVKTFLSPGTSPGIDASISKMKYLIMAFIGLVIIGVIAYYAYKIASKDPIPASSNVSLEISTRQEELNNEKELLGPKSLYGGLLPQIPKSQRFLVNFQPLTASLGGYIGRNVFFSNDYIQRCLKAGIRSYILPISVYTDDNKRPPNWPLSGKPAIVCRNKEGTITSLNALTIQKFCRELMTFKANNPTQSEEPYIVYLEEDTRFTPDHTTQERQYVQLMSDIAKELEVLNTARLTTLGQFGPATDGGSNGGRILTEVSMEGLKGKVILCSNFDTRIQLKDAYAKITPRLHEYINISYKPSVMESIYLSEALGSDGKYGEKTRTAWYVANRNYWEDVPTAADVKKALEGGVQAIPIPFYSVSNAELERIHRQWEGYSMRVKPEGIRYTQPAPVVPKMPSEKLNARVEGARQPGEINVQ